MKANLELDEMSTFGGITQALNRAADAGGLSSFLIEKPKDIIDVLAFTSRVAEKIKRDYPLVLQYGGVQTIRVGLDMWDKTQKWVEDYIVLAFAEVLYCYDNIYEEPRRGWVPFDPFKGKDDIRHCVLDQTRVVVARIYLVKESRSVAHTLGGTPYGSQ